MIERNMLMTSCFGSERRVIVPNTVEVLGKSWFESFNRLAGLVFENDSKLRQIGRSAFSACESLTSIAIPASVEVIEDSAFKKCAGLEECFLDENGLLFRIGTDASFDIPRTVEETGRNCFSHCLRLSWLTFSGWSLIHDEDPHLLLMADIWGIAMNQPNRLSIVSLFWRVHFLISCMATTRIISLCLGP
jgi:hypothetical protein